MRQDALRRAEKAHGKIQEMDAGRRHRSGRRLGAGQAPVLGGEREEFVLAEIRLDLQRRAEFAGLDHPAELEDRRLEPALVADAELHARVLASCDGGGRIGAGEAERLLTEHVLAGLGGLHDLRRM